MKTTTTVAAMALSITGVHAQCAPEVQGTPAPTLGTAVSGGTADLTYAFKGEVAPVNGLYCSGCAITNVGTTAQANGNWYTVDDAAQGTVAPSDGFLCPTDGSACTSVTSGTTASSAGKFYTSQSVTTGAVASEIGVLCPTTAQGTCDKNTCAPVTTGTIADCLGTACQGSSGTCAAVINQYSAPSNGVYCSGCAYQVIGNTAPIDGEWWTVDDVAAGAVAPRAGIICPSDGGTCAAVQKDSTAASAGKFYSSQTISKGTVATEEGVLCPSGGQQTDTATSVALPILALVGAFVRLL